MSKNTVPAARSLVLVGLLAETGKAMRSPATGTPPAQLPGVDHSASTLPVHVFVAAKAPDRGPARNRAATAHEQMRKGFMPSSGVNGTTVRDPANPEPCAVFRVAFRRAAWQPVGQVFSDLSPGKAARRQVWRAPCVNSRTGCAAAK
jgi:hypothetical protein